MNTDEVNAFWEEVKELLARREETSSPMALAFLTYLVPKSLDDRRMMFTTRLEHAKDWVEGRYMQYIRDAIVILLGSERDVVIIVDENAGMGGSGPVVGVGGSAGNAPVFSVATPVGGKLVGTPVVVDRPNASEVYMPVSTGVSLGSLVGGSSPMDSVMEPMGVRAQVGRGASVPDSAGLPGLMSQSEHATPVRFYDAQPLRQNNEQGELVTRAARGVASPSAVMDTTAPAAGSGIAAVFSPDLTYAPSPDPNQGLKTFSNYVVGPSNEYAYSAAMRVAESPGQYFNPLFIYGRSGLGKTHLLLAIKNYVSMYHPKKRVVYAPTSEFVNDFTGAMAGDRDLTSFKRKYHICDILLLDDVQHLEGKEGTSDALFEIFNMFIDHRKQIVLSADRSPGEINLDERFTSRFAGGVTVDIQPPNYEMKAAIFMNYKKYFCNHINVLDIDIPDEVVQHVIGLSGSNIRELEGAVSSIVGNIAFRPIEQRNIPITIEEVESIVGKVFFHKDTRRIDIRTIQQAVEAYYKVSHEDLLSEKRSKNISHPRQVAMYLSRRLTPKSFPEIGKSFGNKDHTTAMYACKNIQAKLLSDMAVKTEVERIAEMITV
ncbi:MAG: chromosomal replication initiator protein DnaA [Coriobacteriales bacterium]|nr:chromosomal replication initiator protein DnaA [Coriobacteriales bacterium]